MGPSTPTNRFDSLVLALQLVPPTNYHQWYCEQLTHQAKAFVVTIVARLFTERVSVFDYLLASAIVATVIQLWSVVYLLLRECCTTVG